MESKSFFHVENIFYLSSRGLILVGCIEGMIKFENFLKDSNNNIFKVMGIEYIDDLKSGSSRLGILVSKDNLNLNYLIGKSLIVC